MSHWEEKYRAKTIPWDRGAVSPALLGWIEDGALPPGRLFNWLRPGGKLFALFMQVERAGGPPFHCALPDMHALFAAERWQWPESEPRRVVHPDNIFELAAVLTRLG